MKLSYSRAHLLKKVLVKFWFKENMEIIQEYLRSIVCSWDEVWPYRIGQLLDKGYKMITEGKQLKVYDGKSILVLKAPMPIRN